jgi:hypothetical protein
VIEAWVEGPPPGVCVSLSRSCRGWSPRFAGLPTIRMFLAGNSAAYVCCTYGARRADRIVAPLTTA